MNNITFGDEKFGHYETVAGGAGAVSKYSILASRQENLPMKKLKMFAQLHSLARILKYWM